MKIKQRQHASGRSLRSARKFGYELRASAAPRLRPARACRTDCKSGRARSQADGPARADLRDASCSSPPGGGCGLQRLGQQALQTNGKQLRHIVHGDDDADFGRAFGGGKFRRLRAAFFGIGSLRKSGFGDRGFGSGIAPPVWRRRTRRMRGGFHGLVQIGPPSSRRGMGYSKKERYSSIVYLVCGFGIPMRK